MKIRNVFSGICAGILALGTTALPCLADTESSDTAYGKAGIVWMIQDQWDHRNTIELEPYDEMETSVISCTHTDVNITGNGQYEVSLEGYHCPDDLLDIVLVGNLGVEFTLDFKEYADLTVSLDECTIDSVTYTFNAQPELEETELGKILKIKNSYGNHADTTPEMDDKPWRTTDPLTVKFTVSGLPTDKTENNPDEDIVTVYGNGSIDNDVAEESSIAEVSEESSDTAVSSTADSQSDTSSKAEEKDSGVNWIIYACIAGGIVVVIVVIAVIAKKKSN